VRLVFLALLFVYSFSVVVIDPASLLHFSFFFNDTATTEIYTLSLHDALPIFRPLPAARDRPPGRPPVPGPADRPARPGGQEDGRSEEHTSELQSREKLVCRLLLEKKKTARLHGSY